MAHSKIIFKHPVYGTIKTAPVGFSFTTCFLGFWPALLRSDFKWAAIILIVSAIAGTFTLGLGGIVVMIFFAVVYNKLYIRDLLEKGYLVRSIESVFTIEELQAQLETVLTPDELLAA